MLLWCPHFSRALTRDLTAQAYILKKTRSERSQVVALSDVNQRDIDAVEAERVQLENHYDRIKKDLKDAVVARESELERTRYATAHDPVHLHRSHYGSPVVVVSHTFPSVRTPWTPDNRSMK